MQKHFSRWLVVAQPLAALAVSFSSFSHAQTGPVPVLGETVVSATRIPQDPSLLPQGVTVITAQDIQAAGLTHANEAVRWLGGVVGRIDTSGGRDQSLDLRGFGETAGSNLVILVDGVRQNEGDMTGAGLSWIPASSIERIEIVRGSGAVLYGEGATAGAINIITHQGLAQPGGSATLGLGSLGTREAQVALNTTRGPWRFQLSGSARDTDNHRDNYANQERNALGRATWVDGATQLSAQLGVSSSEGQLPGGLTLAQFSQNPRQTNTPGDNGSTETSNLLLSGQTTLGDWRLAADWNHRNRDTDFDYRKQPSLGHVTNRADRLGTRAWRDFQQGGLAHKLLIGFDAERWHQQSSGYVFNIPAQADVTQTSNALYARHEVFFPQARTKVFVGARRTVADRESRGNPPGQFASGNTSWDLGAAMNVGAASEVFGKVGSSFRLPNANDYTCYVQFCPTGAPKLLPQESHDAELGWRQKTAWGQWTTRAYRSNLRREIGFDPMMGNVNFDPTRREGLEVDAAAKLSHQVDGGVQWAIRRAVFRSGSYAGNTVPLVPHHALTARLAYRPSAAQQWLLTSQFVSSQRTGDDFDNKADSKIPGYAVVNLRVSQKVDNWTFAIAAHNLLDKRYYNYRTYANPTYESIYPEAGRAFLVSAQRRF